MTAPPLATPPPDLAAAVRGGLWAEVRAHTEARPKPLPPAVALVAARASIRLGEAERGLTVLRAAIPAAGELAGALRLEAGRAAVALGRDPLPWLEPLLPRSAPSALRHEAGAVLRDAWETLPVELLAAHRRRPLPRPLRRELTATLAARRGDVAAAAALLAERDDDLPALRAARVVVGAESAGGKARLDAAGALLSGGLWREAGEVLAGLPAPADPAGRYRLAYLRGRAAYRLGAYPVAAGHFENAIAIGPQPIDRAKAAIQRARIAEIGGDAAAALPFWDAARSAAAAEPEGWDGACRDRVALGRGEEAAAVLLRAPPAVQRAVGPRLVATLLARGELEPAKKVLARLPVTSPVVRMLAVRALLDDAQPSAARTRAAALLADRRAGEWRDLVLDLLPPAAAPATAPPTTADRTALAALAATAGAPAGRAALARALAADPAWARLVAGAEPAPPPLAGPVGALVGVGLEAEAAGLYPQRFPAESPEALAWTARALARWGNGPASLGAGERLWARLDGVPASLVPDALLPNVLAPELVRNCVAAAAHETVSAAWLAAIIRRESRFDERARSGAGAMGVAQIMPELARRLGAAEDEVWQGDRAVLLAAREVGRLAASFGGRLGPVASAYNAGDAVVTSWLAAGGAGLSDPLLAAMIPYRETAGYVRGVREGVELARHLDATKPPVP
jgi:soluble lytic murein transglycosylase-like protein